MCSPKGYGFSALLAINRVWFFLLVLNWIYVFLEEATFSSLSIRKSSIAFHKSYLGATVPATMVINRVSNFW